MRRADRKCVAVAADRHADAGMSVERATASEVCADLGIGCFEERDLPDRCRRQLCVEMNGRNGESKK
jgi:hypothetical protein